MDNIILVTGRGKNAIEDHFDVNIELETFLEARGKTEQLEEIRKISNLINFSYVRQGEPLGLGHAVLVTQGMVGHEPFAVILGDDVIDANPPALQQMIAVYEELQGPVIAVERVPKEEVSAYGILQTELIRPRVHRIIDLVEKPSVAEAPSNLAIIGRYILTPDIFPELEATKSDRTGEIQLTNGLRSLLQKRPLYAVEIDGVRHDTGNKLGFLRAVVYFALRRPDLAGPFREYPELDRPREQSEAAVRVGAARRAGLQAGVPGRAEARPCVLAPCAYLVVDDDDAGAAGLLSFADSAVEAEDSGLLPLPDSEGPDGVEFLRA